ncbi:acyltransferase [Saccharopolyspora indica]|uniref:acyltransferase family protein n=1 Tax=Saccharopolyspora indica TaxID=1229659 RepID=UPI0022EAFFFD|nr:acyltransferase [Saccharopolyspora indica]MDA3647023.1 acyltransferase [Saccharopolyspora indica]
MVVQDKVAGEATGPVAGGSRKIPKLEGVRGLCAGVVLLYHTAFFAGVLALPGSPGTPVFGFLFTGLEVFLPPFFVLSGYLLYRSFAKSVITGAPRPAIGSFLARRSVRILPAFWVLTAFCLLVLNFNSIDGVWYVLRPLLLLHSFQMSTWPAGMEATWTVTTEMTFYLLLPVFAWFIQLFAARAPEPAQRAQRMLLPILLIGAVGLIWQAYISAPSAVSIPDPAFWPPRYFGTCAIGMALAVLSVQAEVHGPGGLFRLVQRHPNKFWLGALVAYLVNLPKPFGTPGAGDWAAMLQMMVDHVLILVFSTLLLLPLLVPDVRSRLMDAVLANRPIRYLGRISYGVYLWHMAVLLLVVGLGDVFGGQGPASPTSYGGAGADLGFWPLLLLVLSCTVAIATVSHFLLEQPLARLVNRKTR